MYIECIDNVNIEGADFMEFYYDPKKAKKLLRERKIELEEVFDLISEGKYLEVLENKSRPEQNIFIMNYKGYIHAVPFVLDLNGKHIIKTAYPCRKFNKLFGGKK